MALVIAVVLILIIGVEVLGDKAKTKRRDSELAKRNAMHDEWVARYVDCRLESRLREFIDNNRNSEAVDEEVLPVLRELKEFSRYCSPDPIGHMMRSFPEYRKVALDIMLAKRGKVSHESAIWGYRAYLLRSAYALKFEQFELVNWIKNTLNQQGYDVNLVYSGIGDSKVPSDCYYWVGTRDSMPLVGEENPHPQRFKPFSRDLLGERR